MSDVLLFPPLPPMPEPPTVPLDERQQTFYRITGKIVEQLAQHDGEVTYTDTTRGFRASAVDLGVLQEILEEALARFDMSQLRQRWDVDVRVRVGHTIVSWIQRCKYVHFDVAENGVHITIETQDDRGYYQYELDVFPGRMRAG
ncbi:MAG TPA: hypothetical protein VEO54_15990 [Thermoanaerobaculia bacterium]|nr:hypothetical protein [Thermoanaerobaculia bacterium]